MIKRRFFITIIVICSLLLPHPSYSTESWLSFLGSTALSTGTTLILFYIGADLILTNVARKAGEEIGKELEKKSGAHQQEQKYSHLVCEKSISLIDYINPPKEVISLLRQLKNQKRYESMGITIPHGILLVGDPGTGKTYLARTLAGELDCPFFEYSAAEFIDKYYGDAGKSVRRAFDDARSYAKENHKNVAFLFIDEFDAIGTRSDDNQSKINQELINSFLTCMDGFAQQQPPVIVVASTNYSDKIDPALKRKGRFGTTIHIPYPDEDTREKLLQQKMHKTKVNTIVAPNLAKKLAAITQGLSHADLTAVVSNAAEKAIEKNIDSTGIDHDCFARALWGIRQENHIKRLSPRSEKESLLKQYILTLNLKNVPIETFLADTEHMTMQETEELLQEIHERSKKQTSSILQSNSLQNTIEEKKQQLKEKTNKDAVELCKKLYPSVTEPNENDLKTKTPEDIFADIAKKHAHYR